MTLDIRAMRVESVLRASPLTHKRGWTRLATHPDGPPRAMRTDRADGRFRRESTIKPPVAQGIHPSSHAPGRLPSVDSRAAEGAHPMR